jgi:hypothetical protein
MKQIRNFIEVLRFALMGGAIVVSAISSVKAQVQDPPPARLIERLDANPGEFRNMVTSDDGQVIAVYTTGAMHLQGLPPIPSVTAQVIVIDRRQGTVELASRTPSGGFQNFSSPPGGFGTLDWGPLSISRDGRYVAFVSSATNLDPAASTPGYYTYLYDRQTQQVRALTADEMNRPGFRGAVGLMDDSASLLVFRCLTLAGLPVGGDEFAFCERRLDNGSVRVVRSGLDRRDIIGQFQISGNGQWLAFTSVGPILTSGEPNPDRIAHLYLLDLGSGGLELVSRTPEGSPSVASSGGDVALSWSGEFIGFTTLSSDLAPGLGPGLKVVIKQNSTGMIRRVSSINPLGSIAPHLSGDGRRLLYLDYDFYLPSFDIMRLYDWDTDTNRVIGRPSNVLPTNAPCGARLFLQSPPADYWQRLAISGDGRTIVFASLSSNFFPGDTPDSCDLFVQSIAGNPAPQPVPVASAGALALFVVAFLLLGVLSLRRLG